MLLSPSLVFFRVARPRRAPHSFPTRRSSDLVIQEVWVPDRHGALANVVLGFADLDGYVAKNPHFGSVLGRLANRLRGADRKSTRLNSSHLVISYAVFCLKKKSKPKNKVR